jgi:hypothetical protein
MDEAPRPSQRARVIESHVSGPESPVKFTAGDLLGVGHRDQQRTTHVWVTDKSGHAGWVPDTCLDMTSEHAAVANRDLDTTDLAIVKDEIVDILEEAGGRRTAATPTGPPAGYRARCSSFSDTNDDAGKARPHPLPALMRYNARSAPRTVTITQSAHPYPGALSHLLGPPAAPPVHWRRERRRRRPRPNSLCPRHVAAAPRTSPMCPFVGGQAHRCTGCTSRSPYALIS